jgi:hypothetical protein
MAASGTPLLLQANCRFLHPPGARTSGAVRRRLHEVILAPVPSVRTYELSTLDPSAYDESRALLICSGREWPSLGYHGGTPIRQSPNGERIWQIIDRPDDCPWGTGDIQLWAEATAGVRRCVASFDYCDISFVNCTLSPDGRFMLLGWPDGLVVFQRA